MALVPFLLSLEQFIRLEDVEYGEDPPDFVFRHEGSRIGVELTELIPTPFGSGGYARKVDFKQWESSAKENPEPRHEFEWGEFTLRESLAAFTKQFDGKSRKAEKWAKTFPENWLLVNIANGSPFGGLVAAKHSVTGGRAHSLAELFAKTTHELFSICQRPHPFQHVILFSNTVILALPIRGRNPHSFPVPSADVLTLGAAASDKYLNWRSTPKSIVENPFLKAETNLGITTT